MWSLQVCVVVSILQGPHVRLTTAAPVGQEDQVTFHVYPGVFDNTTSEGTTVSSGPAVDVDPDYPLTLLVHGFTGSYMAKSMKLIRDALLYKGHKNIVVVDWESLAMVPYTSVTIAYYQVASDNVPLVAKEITSWLKSLHNKQLISYADVHIIGFSLGAQVAGLVGAHLDGELGRITALDPPRLGFADNKLHNKLDSTDAQFVSVIHTSSGFISYAEPIGHVDFYPNGGIPPQPECPQDDIVHSMACSHYMAYKIFSESIYNEFAFNATKCDSWDLYLKGSCDENEHALMGFATTNITSGSFYTKTNARPPFGSTTEGSTIPDSVIALMSYSEEDKQQIATSFLDSAESDENGKYEVSDEVQGDSLDTNGTPDYTSPGQSIMKVKSRHHDKPTTVVPFLREPNNASSRSYHSHVLIFFCCFVTLRYFRL